MLIKIYNIIDLDRLFRIINLILKKNMSNGGNQGGVISPIMFTIYIYQLLLRLKNLGIGCHIHGKYMVILGYADDVTLLSPQ